MAFPEDAVCKFHLASRGDPAGSQRRDTGLFIDELRWGGGVGKSRNRASSGVPPGAFSDVPIEETNFAKYHSMKTRRNARTINVKLMSTGNDTATIPLVRTAIQSLYIV